MCYVPLSKYSFKAKRRKISEDDDEEELADSVRTISALFQAGGGLADQPLEVRVASIGAEIAAAIAHAQSRLYEDDEDDEDGENGSQETIGPNTSGIRGGEHRAEDDDGPEEEEDSDAFPMPLRTRRKGKEADGIGALKRKR